MNIDQTQRLIAHLYCAAISGQQIPPLREGSCGPHWELAEAKKNRYVPLMLWGEAGVGKSETVKWVADNLGIGFVDLRLGILDQGDLLGLPREEMVYPVVYDHEAGAPPDVLGLRFSRGHLLRYIIVNYPDRVKGRSPGDVIEEAIRLAESPQYRHMIDFRMVYSTPSWFPSPGTHGILFLDEVSRSHEDIRNAVFQLILDRKMHMLQLPPGWIIVAANNPPGRNYEGVAPSRDKAFRSRFLHIALDPTVEEWLTYAYSAGVEPSIRSLIRTAKDPDQMLGLSAVPMEDSFPTPRTWVMLNNITSGLDRDLVLEVAQGLVGPQAATAWAVLRTLPDDPVKGSEILSSYAVLQGDRPAPTDIRERIYKFLEYPVPQWEDDGSPMLGPDRKQVVEIGRRDDAIAITFDDITSMLEKRTLAPHEIDNLTAFLQDAFRLSEDVQSPIPGVIAPRPGLGMKDIGYQYLKFWVGLQGIAPVLARSTGLLRRALEEAGEIAKTAEAKRGGSWRKGRRPNFSTYGEFAQLGVSYGQIRSEVSRTAQRQRVAEAVARRL